MKSLTMHMCSEVLRSLFMDCRREYPTTSGLVRDEQRLLALMRSRGLASMMLDLPNLAKILRSGLESGRLVLEGPLSTAVSKRRMVPRLFSGLFLRVFSDDGCLKEDACSTSIAYIIQFSELFKRTRAQCSPDRVSNTVGEYYEIESILSPPSLFWGGVDIDPFNSLGTLHFRDRILSDREHCGDTESGLSGLESIVDGLQSICDSITGELGYFDAYAFTSEDSVVSKSLGHGTGAVADQKGPCNKYKFPSWSDKLEVMFPYDAFGSTNFSNNKPEAADTTSKLIAVPKDYSKPRLIASEPTSNQWCQQIILRWMRYRFSCTNVGTFIDLSDQGKSQALVQSSSVDRSLATVDLSSASDRLTLWCIERAFRKNPDLLHYLNASRTPVIRDAITGRANIFLKKFASQGTAVTFPVQTVFFLACALASLGCTSLKEAARRYRGRVRIYGDDIIIPVEGYEKLVQLLDYLELKVNVAKSYATGHFRESCGLDCYNGDDVTPVKPTVFNPHAPEDYQSLIDSSNNFYKKGYYAVAELLASTVRKSLKIPVVANPLVSSMFYSRSGVDNSHLKSRWNVNLHRFEYSVDRFISIRTLRTVDDLSAFFQYITERPRPETKWCSGYGQRAYVKRRRGWEFLG